MPSIAELDTLHPQSDITGKMVDKHEVIECFSADINDNKCKNSVDDDVTKTKGLAKGKTEELVVEDVSPLKATNGGSLVVVEILEDEDIVENGGELHGDSGLAEEGSSRLSQGPQQNGESHDTTSGEVFDLGEILRRHVPDFDPAQSKKEKKKHSKVFGSTPRSVVVPPPTVGTGSGPGLSDRFSALSLDAEEEGEEALRSRGPGMRGEGMGVIDLPGAYSPSYAQSPGQFVPSPSYDSFATLSAMGEAKVPNPADFAWHQYNTNTNYPVSPPEITTLGYTNLPDAPSPDDTFHDDIQTVITSAMHVRIPGQPDPVSYPQQQSPWGPQTVPSPQGGMQSVPSPQGVMHLTPSPQGMHAIPSPQGLLSGEYHSSRDFQEQEWPQTSPPSSLQGNPPSVSSTTSDPDSSAFCYAGAVSPAGSAGSTGTMVNSPAAAPPPCYPHMGVGSPGQMPESYTLRASTNNNFGIVQVNRTSPGISTGSPPRNKSDDIKKIMDELKAVEQSTKALPPPPYSAPNADYHPATSSLPQQQQSAIPSFQQAFPSTGGGGSIGPMATSTRRKGPYDHPPNNYRNSAISSAPEAPFVTMSQVPLYVPPVQRVFPERSGTEPVYREPRIPPAGTITAQHQPWVQGLTRQQLLFQDYNEPYEGENMLHLLILNLKEEDAIAVVCRMAQLGLDLNVTNNQRQSALLLAVFNNMPRLVLVLVQSNADVQLGDNQGNFPTHYAASHGFVEVINALGSLGQRGHLDELDFSGKTPLMCAVVAHRTNQRFYVNGEEIRHPVDNTRMASLLIELGAQPTKQDASSGKTALHYAISERKLDMVSIVVEGDQNRRVAKVPMSNGNTPLHLAVSLKCEQELKCNLIRYLMSRGADITADNVEKNKPAEYVPQGETMVKECLDGYSRSHKKR